MIDMLKLKLPIELYEEEKKLDSLHALLCFVHKMNDGEVPVKLNDQYNACIKDIEDKTGKTIKELIDIKEAEHD